jgi:hypothetical protein
MPKPSLGSIAPQEFLRRALPIASKEGGIATFASMLNRYYNPAYGKDFNKWLTPGQYEVLKSPIPKGAGAQLERTLSTPAGIQELMRQAQELGGVTDFRSTKYLQQTGGLHKYPDNLIPVLEQGRRIFVTPSEQKAKGLPIDYSENTFFNETPRGPTTPWWKRLGPSSELPGDAAPIVPGNAGASFATGVKRELADLLANSLLEKTMSSQNIGGLNVLPPELIATVI